MDFLKAPILVLALLSDLNMAVGATIDDFLREPSRPPNIALSKGDFDQLLVRAEAGDIEAQYLMGNAYYNGDFVWQGEPIWPQSVSEARKWWLLSAEKGHSKSQFWLGEMSATGIGIPENYSDAFKWYKLSALNGFSFAQYKLGELYMSGRGATQDEVRAYMWFSIAAAQQSLRGRTARDEIRSRLAPQALEQAQALAKKCFESNYTDCGE